MRENRRIILTTLALFIIVAFQSSCVLVQGALVWSDDFADDNYDGWTIVSGEFTCDSTYGLRAVATGWSTASHDSAVAFGMWLFRLEENATSPTDQHVFFMALGNDISTVDGYSLCVDIGTTSYISLYVWNGGSYTLLDQIVRPAGNWGLYEYNITRDITGSIEVSRDDDTIMTTDDDTFDTSTHFLYYAQEGRAIDNIYVYAFDAPPIPDWILPMLIVLAAGIVLGVIVIIRRKR